MRISEPSVLRLVPLSPPIGDVVQFGFGRLPTLYRRFPEVSCAHPFLPHLSPPLDSFKVEERLQARRLDHLAWLKASLTSPDVKATSGIGLAAGGFGDLVVKLLPTREGGDLGPNTHPIEIAFANGENSSGLQNALHLPQSSDGVL